MSEEHRIEESIEFLTQIITAWDGTEQRIALRTKPRRGISFRYTGNKPWKSTYLRALTFSAQNTQTLFPLWNYSSVLHKDLYKAQNRAYIDPDALWGYRDAVRVMLWLGDEDGLSESFGMIDISPAGLIRLDKQVTSDWWAGGASAVPVVYGSVAKEDSLTNYTASAANLNVNIELISSVEAVRFPTALDEFNYKRPVFEIATNARTEYDGLELFVAPPSWVGDDEVSFARNVNRLDNNVGMFYYDVKSYATTMSRTLTFHAYTRELINFYQRFFYRCMGRLKAFYIPTWTTDFELEKNAGKGDTELIVKWNLYYKYYAKQKRRRRIIIFFHDGTIEILKVAGYSYNDDRTKGLIYLLETPSRPLEKEKIRMISFLVKCRQASDALTVAYETLRAAEIKMAVQEVDD